MASSNVHIRHATIEDTPHILKIIKELARYEEEIRAVKATEETLRSTLVFAPSPANPSPEGLSRSRVARALLAFADSDCAEPGNVPVGMALYFYNYSTWRAAPGVYLEDLYVKEGSRRKGYGRALLKALAKEVLEMEGARLDFSVLKWNKDSIKIYEKMGALQMVEWVGMRVQDQDLQNLATR